MLLREVVMTFVSTFFEVNADNKKCLEGKISFDFFVIFRDKLWTWKFKPCEQRVSSYRNAEKYSNQLVY